jgi:hypothetical protein
MIPWAAPESWVRFALRVGGFTLPFRAASEVPTSIEKLALRSANWIVFDVPSFTPWTRASILSSVRCA